MELTKDELEEFKINGFLLLRNFVDKLECDKILDVALVHLKIK